MAEQPRPSTPSVPSAPRTDPANTPKVPTPDTGANRQPATSDPFRTPVPTEPKR